MDLEDITVDTHLASLRHSKQSNWLNSSWVASQQQRLGEDARQADCSVKLAHSEPVHGSDPRARYLEHKVARLLSHWREKGWLNCLSSGGNVVGSMGLDENESGRRFDFKHAPSTSFPGAYID